MRFIIVVSWWLFPPRPVLRLALTEPSRVDESRPHEPLFCSTFKRLRMRIVRDKWPMIFTRVQTVFLFIRSLRAVIKVQMSVFKPWVLESLFLSLKDEEEGQRRALTLLQKVKVKWRKVKCVRVSALRRSSTNDDLTQAVFLEKKKCNVLFTAETFSLLKSFLMQNLLGKKKIKMV